MAKKISNGRSASSNSKSVSKASPVASTPVRNSSIPKAKSAGVTKVIVSQELIAKRAYEISQSPLCGSEVDNWLRAERELKGL